MVDLVAGNIDKWKLCFTFPAAEVAAAAADVAAATAQGDLAAVSAATAAASLAAQEALRDSEGQQEHTDLVAAAGTVDEPLSLPRGSGLAVLLKGSKAGRPRTAAVTIGGTVYRTVAVGMLSSRDGMRLNHTEQLKVSLRLALDYADPVDAVSSWASSLLPVIIAPNGANLLLWAEPSQLIPRRLPSNGSLPSYTVLYGGALSDQAIKGGITGFQWCSHGSPICSSCSRVSEREQFFRVLPVHSNQFLSRRLLVFYLIPMGYLQVCPQLLKGCPHMECVYGLVLFAFLFFPARR